MTIELLPTFKTQAILDVFNHLATAKGEKPLAGWEKSKTALVARIMAGNTEDAIVAAIKATEGETLPGKKPAPAKKKGKLLKTSKAVAKRVKTNGDKKPRTQGVGAFVRQTLLGTPDMSAVDVLSLVAKKWPEAKTSAACVGWYRSQMYKSGELTK